MRKTFLLLTLLISIAGNAGKIGEWKAYMAYGNITDIEPAGNIVYVLSSNSIFSYNVNDESITTYDKVYPLSDCTITHIAWNNTVKRLIIVYDNYNIDLLDKDENVENIPDYYNKVMTENKTVNSIMLNGEYAYLSTAFGIIKINMRDAEISDTYNIGMNVTNCAILQNKIYANTTQGIYEGNLSDNLLDPVNWRVSGDNISFANSNDITVSTDNGYTEYITYDSSNKCYWSNQKDGKLQSYTLNDNNTRNITRSGINPDSPKYNYFGFLKIHQDKLYSCNGIGWDFGHPASIQIFDFYNDVWTTLNNEGVSEKYGLKYKDIITIDIDPLDSRRIMAGAQTGLYEIYDGQVIKHWNQENSPIYSHYNVSDGNKNYNIITSLIFDNKGDLWVANTGSRKNTMLKLNTDYTWSVLDNSMSGQNAGFLKFKSFNENGMLWINNNEREHPAVYLYDPATKTKNEYSNFINEDGVKFNNVSGCKDIAEDKDGNIWVGIDQGLLVLTKEYQNDPTKGFYQIKVPRNDGTNLADYLLSGIDITAIAIDNANRKWIGTDGSGLYLISEDNMVEEEHFTTTNSSILSNNIQSLVIDDTGKVYIGTDKGLCSYQSEASTTNDEMTKDNVWAYPNPVRPDYTGMITITGLSFNADVKITTSNGVLVSEGRSTGGSFQWDGNDLKGKRVASGIYMVNTATEDEKSGTVCKIAIIN